MEIFEDNKKAACLIFTLLVLLGITGIIMAVSISTVEPISYGIKYNKFSKNIASDDVFAGGWYFIGPTNTFIQFPRT